MIVHIDFTEGKKTTVHYVEIFYFSSGLETGIVAAFVSYLLPRTQGVTEIENNTL